MITRRAFLKYTSCGTVLTLIGYDKLTGGSKVIAQIPGGTLPPGLVGGSAMIHVVSLANQHLYGRQLDHVRVVGPLSVPRPYTRKPGWNPAGAMPLSSIVPPPDSVNRTSPSPDAARRGETTAQSEWISGLPNRQLATQANHQFVGRRSIDCCGSIALVRAHRCCGIRPGQSRAVDGHCHETQGEDCSDDGICLQPSVECALIFRG